jgi:uncharacterized protein (TIGR00251 family)
VTSRRRGSGTGGSDASDAGTDAMLALRVSPRAKRAGVIGWHGAAIKIAVRAAPERGRANDEVLAVLSAALGVPAVSLVLESGAASRDKRVRVRGVSPSEARRRLEAALTDVDGMGKSEEPDA